MANRSSLLLVSIALTLIPASFSAPLLLSAAAPSLSSRLMHILDESLPPSDTDAGHIPRLLIQKQLPLAPQTSRARIMATMRIGHPVADTGITMEFVKLPHPTQMTFVKTLSIWKAPRSLPAMDVVLSPSLTATKVMPRSPTDIIIMAVVASIHTTATMRSMLRQFDTVPLFRTQARSTGIVKQSQTIAQRLTVLLLLPMNRMKGLNQAAFHMVPYCITITVRIFRQVHFPQATHFIGLPLHLQPKRNRVYTVLMLFRNRTGPLILLMDYIPTLFHMIMIVNSSITVSIIKNVLTDRASSIEHCIVHLYAPQD